MRPAKLAFVPPMMPTLVDNAPEGDDWIHEVKYDGYRTQIIIQGGTALCYTRNGFDWTEKYPHISAAAKMLNCKTAIIDGEVIVPDAKGASDFSAVRRTIKSAPHNLAFVAFDLLHLNGKDMRPMPCLERRAALWDLVAPAEGAIQYSHHMATSGAAFFAAVEAMELEGMVSKLAVSPYISGEGRNWLKTKCYTETDYEIAGVQRERGKPAMAIMVDAKRNYVGSAFITFAREQRERLWARVQAKAGPPPKGMPAKVGAEWIKPGLVGRVKHLRGEKKLRHASLREFRDASD